MKEKDESEVLGWLGGLMRTQNQTNNGSATWCISSMLKWRKQINVFYIYQVVLLLSSRVNV